METVTREINGKTYNFRMSRKSIRKAEDYGLVMDGETKAMTLLYAMWFAAIATEQPMSKRDADELLDNYLDAKDCPEKFESLMDSLAGQYAEVFE